MRSSLFVFIAAFFTSLFAGAAGEVFMDSQALGFKSCKGTGDSSMNVFRGETVEVSFQDDGVFVRRANGKVQPYFTSNYLCSSVKVERTVCDAGKMDAANDPAKPSNRASFEKKCLSASEMNIPESNRSIPARLNIGINSFASQSGEKTGSGYLNCTGPNNLNYANSLTLSECK